MPSLQELEAPIDAFIAQAMIESAPSNWRIIILNIWRPEGALQIGTFSHSIESPEGFPPVSPVDSLYEGTQQLDKLFQAHNATISKATYRVELVDNDQWKYQVQFRYMD